MGVCRLAGQARIISVDDGESRLGESLDQFPLPQQDVFERAKGFDVGGPNAGEHPDLGLGQPTEMGDVTPPGGSQFEHGEVVRRGQFQQGQGQADFVVEVPAVLPARVTGGQHRVQQFAGGGLADRTGDSYHQWVDLATMPGGEFFERSPGVGNHNLGTCNLRKAIFHDRGHCTGGVSLRDELVTIVPGTAEGEKEIARAGLPGVGPDTCALQPFGGPAQGGVQHMGQGGEGPAVHGRVTDTREGRKGAVRRKWGAVPARIHGRPRGRRSDVGRSR